MASALALPLAVLLPVQSTAQAAGPAASAAAEDEIRPQEPGVTLRVFDVQIPLDEYCTLKPGSTPNVDKIMPTIDWTSDEDFGLTDQFVTEVTGYLDVETAGTYEFRITSDDGARLLLDGTEVVDNPGAHGVLSEEGSVDLEAGYNALLIDHFDNAFGQRLLLEWRPPGSQDFVVVPNSVLSTDADVTRVTSPGRKSCENISETPGDGLPLAEVHPDYTLTDLRPDGFEPQVTGMDWLPDGRMVISTWGGDRLTELGEVYLIDGASGDGTAEDVTYTKVAENLTEPMGIKYVDGTIYVSEKDGLTALRDTDGDEVADEYDTFATWPFGENYHEFAFGLLYEDGYFYITTGIAMVPGGNSLDPQLAENRGSVMKISKDTGEVEYVAGGLRTPNGLGWGTDGSMYVADNQGVRIPTSKLVKVEEGAFYNHFTNPDGPYDDQPVTEPVLWMPHGEISNSPSNPVVLTEGVFAGQLAIGDVTYGGLQRAYLEDVAGQEQGAVFRMTQGLESGVSRTSIGPDGSIYVGGIGWSGNWGQAGKLGYGLQKLTYDDNNAFDMLEMRAVDGGFEIEYTQPLSEETAQDLAAKYTAAQWRYVATPQYGGPKVDEEDLDVTSATLSEDGKTVTLAIDGLEPGRVVHVHSPRPFASESGQELWSTEAWYTLNRLPDGSVPPPVYEAEAANIEGGAGWNSNHAGYTGSGFVDRNWEPGARTTFAVRADEAGSYDLALRYANGQNSDPQPTPRNLSLYVNGEKVKQTWLPSTVQWDNWQTQVETVTLKAGANTIAYVHEDDDRGHVNLDNLTVTPTERITLFDGSDLDAWEKTDGSPATWPVADGTMESFGGDIRTKETFEDFRMHAEWYQPEHAPDVTGQSRGNSGIYIQERYELQVLESFGIDPPATNDAGSIYLQKAPDVNAATPMGTWQTYDITFRSARFDADGNKTEDARITVVWNGQVVHDDVAVTGKTGNGQQEGPTPGHIKLQDHGDPGLNPMFRNIWIERLSGQDDAGPEEVAVSATSEVRCLAGRPYVAVRVVNDDAVDVDVDVTTPYGTRSFTDVAPGKNAYQSFAVRDVEPAADSVTVTARPSDGSDERETVTRPEHAQPTCG
ncbi:family 16 glycoside hydrolase [Cellulosimicrobium arenosum]|uniref:family 16 glycoside hydrolase n=1 Tax=Cellulosimicrobium arenosum TaxID=2708133 RepID=UPI001F50F8EF|nr:family 16 glycoside hydrolase [Cellulosimicrobium arenosum]